MSIKDMYSKKEDGIETLCVNCFFMYSQSKHASFCNVFSLEDSRLHQYETKGILLAIGKALT